jgi:sec-independent protein translocase protein TatC
MFKRRNAERRLTLAGHLRELRNRLLWSAGFILLGAIGGWFLFEPVFSILQQPIDQVARDRNTTAVVNFSGVASAFDLRIQVSIFLGVLITSPIWLWNFWAFISPGLKKKEKKYAIGFVVAAVPLFLIGTALAWVSLPLFVIILIGFTPEGSSNVMNASEYVLFAIRILLVFGLAFVMPVILVIMNLLGVVSARGILKGWRLALFLIAFVSALATPAADPMSMFLLMLPLSLLFFGAVGIAWINDARRSKRQEKLLEEVFAEPDVE